MLPVLEAFERWKKEDDTIGDHPDDIKPWLVCFTAGWMAALKDIVDPEEGEEDEKGIRSKQVLT
ncbi:hypothetical protein KAR91_34650 [Candidatus Pacearchaeota archaeon]|nr:hypothetical protein [Candidatus Pacearchaeota archaeon]